MPNDNFTLRAMQPSDSSAIARLITEFDADLTTRFLIDPYTAIISGTEFPTAGVVVERAGVDGLVGMGTVRFSRVQFNGEVLPLAFLDGLKVYKDFRGQGLGYQIANWRIQKARELYGDDCVIATGMLHDNHASYGVAKKWCREFMEAAIEALFVPVRTRPPRPMEGITVHELASEQFQEFSHKQNTFYKNYNLYNPNNLDSMSNALAVSPEGKRPYRFYTAVDARGNLRAGAQIWSRGTIKSDTVNHPPSMLRILNPVLHILPADFVIRDTAVNGIWYEPGQENVARFLWEHIRWECKDTGSVIAIGFDARDPARGMVTLKPWNQPRPKITIALHGPTPIDRQKYLFSIGRV